MGNNGIANKSPYFTFNGINDSQNDLNRCDRDNI